MKGIDLGIASIYRTVQGLAATRVASAQRKREMMQHDLRGEPRS